VNYKEMNQMSTKSALKLAEIAAMGSDARSKAATIERAAVRRAAADGKRKPPTPVSDWIAAHGEVHKASKAVAKRTTGSGGSTFRLDEKERVRLFNAALKAGANTMSAVKRHIRTVENQPCSGKWIRPLLAQAAKDGKLPESAPRKAAPAKKATAAKKAPAKAAAKKATAPVKKAGPKTFRGPITKASQTRRPAKKAITVAARRRSTPAKRVTKRVA
jgi:hypothetical protein